VGSTRPERFWFLVFIFLFLIFVLDF